MAKFNRVEPENISSNWDLNQERVFTESILNQRIQFFLIFFAIIVAGVVLTYSTSKIFVLLILFTGAIISWALSLTIFRLYGRVKQILRNLSQSDTHPFAVIGKRTKGKSMGWIVGYFIPVFCSSIITIGFLVVSSGYIDFTFPSNRIPIKEKIENNLPFEIKSGTDTTKPKQEKIEEFKSIDSVVQN